MSVNHGAEVSDPRDYPAEFARIEAAVDAGQTDLRALGFWRLLAKVKADPVLAHHWAEQAGRIDRKAFEARALLLVPVWFGNALLLVGTLAGAFAVAIALTTDSQTLAGLALVFAALDWSATFHAPAHWLVGRAVGMRFIAYFIRDLIPPFPGVKIDYATYLRVPRRRGRGCMPRGRSRARSRPSSRSRSGRRATPGLGRLGDRRVRGADHRHRRLHLDAHERLEAVPA